MSLTIQERRDEARGDVRRYAEGDLRQRLRWGAGEIRLDDPPHGARSLIYFAHPASGKSVAIQAFEKPKEAQRFLAVLKLAGASDLPMPQLIHTSLGGLRAALGISKGPYTYLVTEFAPGGDLDSVKGGDGGDGGDGDYIGPLARAVARLHLVREKRWGKPGKLKGGPIREDWRASVASRMKDLKRAEGIKNEEVGALEGWFAAAIDAIPEPTEFNLCHHHLAADDILYDAPSGRVTIVDCASLQFSRAARDLAALRMGLFEGENETWARFTEAYDAAMSGGSGEVIGELGPELRFFEAFYLLVKARSAIGSPERFGSRLGALMDVADEK